MLRFSQFVSSLLVAASITLLIMGGLSVTNVALADQLLSSCTCTGSVGCPNNSAMTCPGVDKTCDQCACNWTNYPNLPAIYLCVPL